MFGVEHYRAIKKPEAIFKVNDKVVIITHKSQKYPGIVQWIGRKFMNIARFDIVLATADKYSIETQRSIDTYMTSNVRTMEQDDYETLIREAWQTIANYKVKLSTEGLHVLEDGVIFAIADLLTEYYGPIEKEESA